MNATIDDAGRIVIPKSLRLRLGLTEGCQVVIRESDGHIEIEPAPIAVRLERSKGGLVAVPEEPVPTLTDSVVRETLEKTREPAQRGAATSRAPKKIRLRPFTRSPGALQRFLDSRD